MENDDNRDSDDTEKNVLRNKYRSCVALITSQKKKIKKFEMNSEYLKNVFLNYFEGKIDRNQLLPIIAVGLGFNDDERKKARNSLNDGQTTWWNKE